MGDIQFIENCHACLVMNNFSCKARCRFMQYMADKPDKFGIKFWFLVDVDSKYVSNGIPYFGKDNLRPANESLPENVIMQLMDPYLKKGRNITTDSFFTLLKLAERLKAQQTSLVGTMNRARREIRDYEDITGTSLRDCRTEEWKGYYANRNKNVPVLSTIHWSVNIRERRSFPLP